MAQALVGSGWRALVASSGGPRVRELERIGGEHIALPLASKSPLTLHKNATRLADIIRSNAVDIVHARSRAPAWSAYRAAKREKRPFVTTFHGVYGLGPFGLKKLYNRVMTFGDPVIAISEFIAEHMMTEYNVGTDRIRLVYRGVDLDLFDPDAVTSARMITLSQDWRLPDDGPVILLPGRFTSWKGHALLVDALALLQGARKLPNGWRCLFVGPPAAAPSYQNRLAARIAATGLSGRIQIIDTCRDMAAAYMVTDVVVSASTRPEAFGRVVAEAQAMGRPVVAPAHGAAPEILLPGVTGWLFTPSDPHSLAGALEQAIGISAQGRADLAQQARQHIVENFGREQMAEATLHVYEEAIAKAQAGSP